MKMNFSTDTRQKIQQGQLREELLLSVEKEKNELKKKLESFYGQEKHDQQSCQQLLNEIIAAVDSVLNSGDWEGSLFLRNTIRPLKQLREQAINLQSQLSGESKVVPLQAPTLADGMLPVYISIFQMDGHNMKKWAMQLRSLSKYMIGRPVYKTEPDVQQMIRTKLEKSSEAYVIAGIPESGILEERRQDRLGSILVTLKEGIIRTENILEFVHLNKHYYLIDGELILKE